MKSIFLTFISLFMLLSCSNNNDDSFTPKNITPTLIAQGSLFSTYSNINSANNIVINSDPDWNSFMSNMDNPNILSMTFTETNIDFNNFTIIAVFDQPRPTGGYEITITNIIENNDNVLVDVNNNGNGDATQMPTHPYYIVKTPKITKPIVFQ